MIVRSAIKEFRGENYGCLKMEWSLCCNNNFKSSFETNVDRIRKNCVRKSCRVLIIFFSNVIWIIQSWLLDQKLRPFC